ncbi:MAG: LLM class flavin-dependent oxidoreductase [Nocardioidaceae bacterium]|nr:LLM class flavin-dependent oxidoreductase [Nocardioidaceae bacterium]
MTLPGKPRRSDDRMRFGLMWPNTRSQNVTSGVVAAQNPDVLSPQAHLDLARTCEDIGLDYVFFADSYTVNGPASVRVGHGEPRLFAPIWAAAVIGATRHLGVVTTLHTQYLAPALIARIGANLDVLSGGRWGWNVVPGSKPAEADLFGLPDRLDHDARYQVAAETVSAVKELWRNGLEPTSFHGEHVDVTGALCGPVPVQRPCPPLFNPGLSPSGLDLIAGECDFGFSAVVDDLAQVRASVDRLAAAATAAGRHDGPELVGSIGIVLGESQAAAEEEHARLLGSVDLDAAAGFADFFLASSRTYQELFADDDREQLVRRIALGAGSTVLVGTAEHVAERLVEIERETGLRNFLLLPFLWSADQVGRYRSVLDHLEKRGAWTPPESRGWSW